MLDSLLRAIVADPQAEDRYLVLADWLEEHDDPRRAELLRLHRRLLATCCEPERHPERVGWQARIVELIAEGVRPCVPQKRVGLGEAVEMVFNFIPPGSFLMGSPPQEEWRQDSEVLHRVTLTKGFWLSIYPVTQAQWQALMGSNPSRFKGDDQPVESVPWYDCEAFCKRLDENFRLPTEAEWEYACRAGTATPFHFGGTISPEQANYNCENAYGRGRTAVSSGTTTPVGSFPPNAWGLFDVHGNVSEWCQDPYGAYPQGDATDSAGGTGGNSRVLRGGSWYHSPDGCRSARRGFLSTRSRDLSVGFRVLLSLRDQGP